MGTLKGPPKQLSPIEAAYIAGMVDGDGCISTNLGRGITLRLTVATTSEELARWLRRTTRAGSVWASTKRYYRRQRTYRWQTSSRQAADIIEQILPFLVVKREQAIAAMNLRSAQCHGAMARAFDCVQRIRRLNSNKKGAALRARGLLGA